MKKVMTDEQRYMAYVLNVEFGYIQKDIAELMDINSATINSAILKIKNAEKDKAYYDQLRAARLVLKNYGFITDYVILNMNFDLLTRMNKNRNKKEIIVLEDSNGEIK